MTFDLVTKHIQNLKYTSGTPFDTSLWCSSDRWFAARGRYKSCLSYTSCLWDILTNLMLQSLTHSFMCEEMACQRVPGSTLAPRSVKMLPVCSGRGCPYRLAFGCHQDSRLLWMRSRPPLFVKPALSTPRHSGYFLCSGRLDDGSASGSLRLGRAWVGRSACGPVRVIFMSPNLLTRATMSLVHSYVG